MADLKEDIKDNIAAINIAMLITLGVRGDLHSRPMYTLRIDENDEIWFFTRKDSVKVDEIEDDKDVNLSYADIHSHTYISVTGKVRIVDDASIKRELWDPVLETWFDERSDSDELVLLAVKMGSAGLWNSEKKAMEQF